MEWAIIRQLLNQLHQPEPQQQLPLGPGHDCAIVRPAPDRDLVLCQDVLNSGVHFPPDTAPYDIGWKALAVNLSDLAAAGATPRWMLLGLSLPGADSHWAEAFAQGMKDLLLTLPASLRPNLIGGDTTRGPLSISVQLLGEVPAGQGLSRSGAQAGDGIWLSGPVGQAAAALHGLQQSLTVPSELLNALNRPEPALQTGLKLLDHATACIDISDGLLADLGHILEHSGCGACLDATRLQTTAALQAFCRQHQLDPLPFQLAGGDDYRLCFTLPREQEREQEPALTELLQACQRIGSIEAEPGLRLLDKCGSMRVIDPRTQGYQHFV